MRMFGRVLSITKAPVQTYVRTLSEANPEAEETRELPGVREILADHDKALAALTTAVNRIERKQNRWLEVLNLKDDGPPAPAVPAPPPGNGQYAGVPGEEEF